MKKMYRYMLSIKTYQLFGLLFVISLFTNILVGTFEYFFSRSSFSNHNEIGSIGKRSVFYFFYGVVGAPLLETAISQRIVIGVCRTFIKNNLICVIISAILFGLMHLTSITKIIATAFGGLCLGLFYTVLQQKKLNAFWLTALFHASWNLLAFTINFIK